MRRTALFVVAATFVAAVAAYAQENPGAGRVDVTIAPVGGMFFTNSNTGETDFGNYAMAGAVTFNINPQLAVEGEFGSALGVHQTIAAGNTIFNNQRSPSLWGYNANLIVHPTGSNHTLAPYVVGGIGGMTLLSSDSVKPLGITSNTSYLTGNVGGGMKWFAARRWGVRADYRLFAVRDKESAPAFFGRTSVRYGHRIYGGLLLNY
jgi:hypothetical protein